MVQRIGSANWDGTLEKGRGTLSVKSGNCQAPFTYGTRFGEEPGTNPEELIGAAHAACVAMSLASRLEKAGYFPQHIHCTAAVNLAKTAEGFTIDRIDLMAEAMVDGITDSDFRKIAEDAKNRSPVTRLLAGAEISLTAALIGKHQEESVT